MFDNRERQNLAYQLSYLSCQKSIFLQGSLNCLLQKSNGLGYSLLMVILIGDFLCLLLFILVQLFSNGMRESEQRHVTLRINASGTLSNFTCRFIIQLLLMFGICACQ